MNLLVESVNVICSSFVPFGVGALLWFREGAVEGVVSFVDLLLVCGYTSVSVLEISFSLLQAHLFILVFLLVPFHFFDHAFCNVIVVLFHE